MYCLLRSASQGALADDATYRRRAIFAVAPRSVEAIVIVVEPEGKPAILGSIRPGRSYLVFGPELSVDDDYAPNVANDRRA